MQVPPPSHPTLSQPHPCMPYSPSPSVSQEHHWEPHHQSQSQHSQPVHPVQQDNVHHASPPPPSTIPSSLSIQNSQYSHPILRSPPVVHHHEQRQHQPQHTTYMQAINPPSSTSSQTSLARASPQIVTNSIAVPEVDIRTPYPTNWMKSSARENTMSEIDKLCFIFYDFASRYSTLSSVLPYVQPSQTEVTEMARPAREVVRLWEVLRQMDGLEDKSSKNEEVSSAIFTSPDNHRPPKRPWEDMAQDGQTFGDDMAGIFPELSSASITSSQTTAEQDMVSLKASTGKEVGRHHRVNVIPVISNRANGW
ncbi:hypothetical protein C8J55DRAFT_554919 [Lentinula edodes]|uniref:Uncharacterized protein n=1 Tax=Lentinula lateritia TaxID=40482 RepID=A0A9W9AZT3_9AGAR|nr:hypothetical protein C8J55DRAFT_554919 [Lentinula edodes]